MTPLVHLSDRQSFNKRLHNSDIEVLLLRLLERLEDRTKLLTGDPALEQWGVRASLPIN
jgi:hypothetical protein